MATMKAYEAYSSKIILAFDCTEVFIEQWDSIMDQSVNADGRKIRKMIKEQIPKLYERLALNHSNPYESRSKRTNKYLIYVHSAIEYFLKIN